MKYEKLNQEMTRFHDNIKPRLTNPTFASFNVGTTLGTSFTRSKSMNTLGLNRNQSSIDTINKGYTSNDQRANNENDQKIQTRSSLIYHRKSQSNLLNYGMNSLNPIRKQINSKDVYEKQARKYNIVTIQPKQYIDTINVFPKYRFENSDENYYKKMFAQKQLAASKEVSPIKSQTIQAQFNKKLDLNPERSQIPIKPIRGRLLNNIDQLNGIL